MASRAALGQLDATDRWFLECRAVLESHFGRPPSIRELAAYCRRSQSVAHAALTRATFAGELVRDSRGRYVRPPNQGGAAK